MDKPPSKLEHKENNYVIRSMTGNVFPLGRPLRPKARERVPARIPPLDAGGLHEIHAAPEDWAAAMAFALFSTIRRDSEQGRHEGGKHRAGRHGQAIFLIGGPGPATFPVLPCAEGLAALGLAPEQLVIVQTASELDLLRAGLEAARCPGVGTVLLQTQGRLARYDLTTSRRLALAAEQAAEGQAGTGQKAGKAVIVLRGDAPPRPSAARTRWAITSAPSTALEANAPGWPAIEAELLRQRGGIGGLRWRLEWNAEHGTFREADRALHHGPALSGAVVPVPGVRAGAGSGGFVPPRAA